MNEAIKLAIEKATEQGYDPGKFGYTYSREKILLDPKFWQALGKALGWIEFHCSDCKEMYESNKQCPNSSGVHPLAGWQIKALRYYELVLTGGDVEKYFKELLNTH
jgi:hypothetical protein